MKKFNGKTMEEVIAMLTYMGKTYEVEEETEETYACITVWDNYNGHLGFYLTFDENNKVDGWDTISYIA